MQLFHDGLYTPDDKKCSASERRRYFMEDIKVLLVDDNTELRHNLRMTLAAQDGITVVGECGNG